MKSYAVLLALATPWVARAAEPAVVIQQGDAWTLQNAADAATQLPAAAPAVMQAATLPALSVSFEKAYARVENNQLVVGTGGVERRWKATGEGLVTVSIKSTGTGGREWVTQPPVVAADWAHPGIIPAGSTGELASLAAVADDDEGFMSKHLKVSATFVYPAQNLTVRYEIRAFPDVAGLMTQLWVMGKPVGGRDAAAVRAANAAARVDYLPVAPDKLKRLGWGIYNHPSSRGKFKGTPIACEESLPGNGLVTWANGICLADDQGGLLLVKESNHAIQHGTNTGDGTKTGGGTNTGAFILDAAGVQNTGWALTERDLNPNSFSWCWASWQIAYSGGTDERELALKRFDRARFPIDVRRDMWTNLCGWGNYIPDPQHGRLYANQDLILKMIDDCAETGIDMLLIDDGWQTEDINVMAPKDGRWRPKARALPNGWQPVADAAKQKGIALGLWAMSQAAGLDDIVWNQQQLGLKQFKLDFASFESYPKLCATRERARAFFKATGHQCVISWDITDQPTPYGYYWCREYANIHPWNQSTFVYTPANCLRDYWLLAAYQNLNKYQLSMNNPELVNTELVGRINKDYQLSDLKKSSPELFTTGTSDTARHGIGYCLAMTFMGTPQIWAMPHMMSEGTKAEFTKTLALFKPHQKNIFTGFAFAIGDCPDNASWAGFQSVDDTTAMSGYLTVFRELKNTVASKRLRLRFMTAHVGRKIQIDNLRTGTTSAIPIEAEGTITLAIEKPADYLFLKYRLLAAGDKT